MVDIEVPADHDRGHVALAGTPPNENESYLGRPRVEDIRVPDRNPRDLTVRTREDGTRVVGVREQYADRVREFFAEEYGVAYSDDNKITGRVTSDTTSGGNSATPDTTSGENQPAPAGDTSDAHWNAVVSAIEAGAYDDELDVVEANDDRQSVQQAIGERQEVTE